MLKKLCSPWIGSIVGLAAYLGVTAATWNAATSNKSGAVEAGASDAPPKGVEQASWMYNNMEVESLVKELREEQAGLAKREADLKELAARLQSEREELNQLTQAVHRLQKEFDASVVRVADEETTNLKRLAKTYSGLEPEGTATIFRQMDDGSVVKILMFMKEAETGPILGALSKLGEAEAKRAGELTERLRVAIMPKKK